jgi:hypothetical protein
MLCSYCDEDVYNTKIKKLKQWIKKNDLKKIKKNPEKNDYISVDVSYASQKHLYCTPPLFGKFVSFNEDNHPIVEIQNGEHKTIDFCSSKYSLYINVYIPKNISFLSYLKNVLKNMKLKMTNDAKIILNNVLNKFVNDYIKNIQITKIQVIPTIKALTSYLKKKKFTSEQIKYVNVYIVLLIKLILTSCSVFLLTSTKKTITPIILFYCIKNDKVLNPAIFKYIKNYKMSIKQAKSLSLPKLKQLYYYYYPDEINTKLSKKKILESHNSKLTQK